MLFSKEKTFEQLFTEVPPEQTKQLLAFREEAAYQTIAVHEKNWRYRTMGSGQQAMILLPGGFTLADIWMNTALAFSKTYRLMMPDAYARQEIYQADQVCEAILAMMDAEQVTQAVFVGLAAGGDLAQYILHKHPERVAHLVLSHCDILGDPALMDDTRTRNTLNFYKRAPEKMIRKMMLRQLEHNLPADGDWREYTLAYYRDSIRDLRKKIVIEYVKKSYAMKKEFEFMAARIRMWQGEILFLASDDDNITLASIKPLKKFYPAAKIHRFEQGQNHVHLLYARDVNQVINQFLENMEEANPLNQ